MKTTGTRQLADSRKKTAATTMGWVAIGIEKAKQVTDILRLNSNKYTRNATHWMYAIRHLSWYALR